MKEDVFLAARLAGVSVAVGVGISFLSLVAPHLAIKTWDQNVNVLLL
jgi:ABC-type Fe3+-siderophore transport system permease subunit